ncbi:hypothetical protein D3C77_788950 [compost metagenome]
MIFKINLQLYLASFQQRDDFGLRCVSALALSLQFLHILQFAFRFGFEFSLARAQRLVNVGQVFYFLLALG